MFGREKPRAPQTESEQLEAETHEKFDPALNVLKGLAHDLRYPDYDITTPRATALRVAFKGAFSDEELEEFKKFIAGL